MIDGKILTVKQLREAIGVPEFMSEWADDRRVYVRSRENRLEVFEIGGQNND